MAKIRLVIVDDHQMFLDGISNVLSKQDDMEILKVVDNANEALHFLKDTIPDLLITDISMPEMNGLEFVKIVKQQYPDVKILVVSMFQQIQSFKGIDGYLLKETGFDELIKAIYQIVVDDKPYFYSDYKASNQELDFNKKIITRREKEIIQLIARELTTDQIADTLFISKHTVETHKKNIFLKLQVNSVVGLMKKALYFGYVS
ncbi:response regulator transcription factor [uncultured Kordia sp.]|uniref:response regulator transcription factor n=1 Tax=uncultured Kordia sp. TaxID=507699 RepID=UPI00260B574E|nr:response regulator transcription factor [uncultured Kordia sp.]